jgi:hypothetical protein
MREVLLQSALVFTLAGSWLAPALSEEVKIGHLETNDDTGINWIYFICNTSEDRLRMQCQTFQTMIYKKKTQAQVDEAIKEQASRPALEEFNAEIGSACSDLVKMNVDQAMSKGTGFDGRPINKRVVLAGLGLLKDTIEVCHHPSEESARALLTEIVKNGLRVCQVHSSYAEEYFEWKEASHSWVSQQGSAIPSFFRGPKCNRRLALRCDNSRMTSPEARVRGSELSRKRPRHAQCAPSGPPFAPYEGQRASQSGRSRNEGIPEATGSHWNMRNSSNWRSHPRAK